MRSFIFISAFVLTADGEENMICFLLQRMNNFAETEKRIFQRMRGNLEVIKIREKKSIFVFDRSCLAFHHEKINFGAKVEGESD